MRPICTSQPSRSWPPAAAGGGRRREVFDDEATGAAAARGSDGSTRASRPRSVSEDDGPALRSKEPETENEAKDDEAKEKTNEPKESKAEPNEETTNEPEEEFGEEAETEKEPNRGPDPPSSSPPRPVRPTQLEPPSAGRDDAASTNGDGPSRRSSAVRFAVEGDDDDDDDDAARDPDASVVSILRNPQYKPDPASAEDRSQRRGSVVTFCDESRDDGSSAVDELSPQSEVTFCDEGCEDNFVRDDSWDRRSDWRRDAGSARSSTAALSTVGLHELVLGFGDGICLAGAASSAEVDRFLVPCEGFGAIVGSALASFKVGYARAALAAGGAAEAPKEESEQGNAAGATDAEHEENEKEDPVGTNDRDAIRDRGGGGGFGGRGDAPGMADANCGEMKKVEDPDATEGMDAKPNRGVLDPNRGGKEKEDPVGTKDMEVGSGFGKRGIAAGMADANCRQMKEDPVATESNRGRGSSLGGLGGVLGSTDANRREKKKKDPVATEDTCEERKKDDPVATSELTTSTAEVHLGAQTAAQRQLADRVDELYAVFRATASSAEAHLGAHAAAQRQLADRVDEMYAAFRETKEDDPIRTDDVYASTPSSAEAHLGPHAVARRQLADPVDEPRALFRDERGSPSSSNDPRCSRAVSTAASKTGKNRVEKAWARAKSLVVRPNLSPDDVAAEAPEEEEEEEKKRDEKKKQKKIRVPLGRIVRGANAGKQRKRRGLGQKGDAVSTSRGELEHRHLEPTVEWPPAASPDDVAADLDRTPLGRIGPRWDVGNIAIGGKLEKRTPGTEEEAIPATPFGEAENRRFEPTILWPAVASPGDVAAKVQERTNVEDFGRVSLGKIAPRWNTGNSANRGKPEKRAPRSKGNALPTTPRASNNLRGPSSRQSPIVWTGDPFRSNAGAVGINRGIDNLWYTDNGKHVVKLPNLVL